MSKEEAEMLDKTDCISVHSVQEEKEPQPDEGIAWLMAIICALSMFSTWGSNASYGVFLNYYITHDTFVNATMYDYALIGGIVIGFAQGLAPFSAVLYNILGIRSMIIMGVSLQTVGYILSSFSTKLWQLYMTQGVLIGISFNLVFIPSTLVIPTWFVKKRATAFGILVSGVGLGGVVFSLSLSKIIEISNFRWGLRFMALVTLITAAPSLYLRPRTKLPPIKDNLNWKFVSEKITYTLNPIIFRSIPLILLTIWFCLAVMGYVVMLYSLSSYATSIGLDTHHATYITVVLNVGQFVGRPTMGHLCDKYGRSNIAIIICFFNCIIILAWWTNTFSYGNLIAFAFVIGCTLGIGSAACNAIASDLIEPYRENLQPVWTYLNIFCGMSCIPAEVIGLSLKTKGKMPFLYCQIYLGVSFFVCGVMMMVIRSILVRKKLTIKGEVVPSSFFKNMFYKMKT
ncbi:probable transporter Mch2p [[Candida] jaroonii]|uniref:Probable transporter Mch2p n=1 Tax=[Candida] jaroonii TaxID=467808 RepID=A0ACA9Y1R0_9ASCO|nr:probable transporter Mch2p [[Candida] jaroonii]